MSNALIEVRDLVVEYPVKGIGRKPFRALEEVSLEIEPGECVGLVGESGSGKSTLGRAILGLAPVSGGRIHFSGRDIGDLRRAQRRELAKDIQVVFQDPYSSLNPALSVHETLVEPLRAQGYSMRDASARVDGLLERVALPRGASRRMPSEFSGGQRQRVAIARALALSPKLIVCDEAVSALDPSTQTRVLELLSEIQRDTGVAYLFISHDLAVVRHMSHRVAVMYRGSIVEQGDAARVTSNPEHPYTQRLLLAAPVADPKRQAVRRELRRRLLESDQSGAASVVS